MCIGFNYIMISMFSMSHYLGYYTLAGFYHMRSMLFQKRASAFKGYTTSFHYGIWVFLLFNFGKHFSSFDAQLNEIMTLFTHLLSMAVLVTFNIPSHNSITRTFYIFNFMSNPFFVLVSQHCATIGLVDLLRNLNSINIYIYHQIKLCLCHMKFNYWRIQHPKLIITIMVSWKFYAPISYYY